MGNVTKIKVIKGKKDWYYHGLARNGKIVVSARGYNTRFNAMRAARKAFPYAEVAYE